MEPQEERVAFPLTFYLKREGRQWAALSPQVTISSCGETVDNARQALEDAVETYVLYMIERGRMDQVFRPLPQEQVDDFLNDPPGEWIEEEHVLCVLIAKVSVNQRQPVQDVYFARSITPASLARGHMATP